MILRTENGALETSSIFKLVFVSYAIGALALFGGFFLLAFFFGTVTGSLTVNGEVVEGSSHVAGSLFPFLILLPLIVLMQAVMIAGVAALGVVLYRLKRPIEMVSLRLDRD